MTEGVYTAGTFFAKQSNILILGFQNVALGRISINVALL